MSWAIYNSLKGWTFYDLTDREVQLLIKSMSVNEVRLTQVCSSVEKKWKNLTEVDFPNLFNFDQGDANNYPSLDLQSQESGDTEYFAVKTEKPRHPRLHERYELELTCLIFSTTRQFVTKTIDLSEGGIYFQDTVPDWIAGYFLVGVQAPETIYQLMCSMVEDQKERKRVQIVSEDNDPQFVAYKQWLLTLKK